MDEFRNKLKASLLGAKRVMLLRPVRAAWYGWKKVVRFDSCGMLARTSVNDMFWAVAVAAKARVRAEVFMLTLVVVFETGSNLWKTLVYKQWKRGWRRRRYNPAL